MKKFNRGKQIAAGCGALMLVLILFYYFSNPASMLKDKQIKEIGIYALSDKTLWNLGYNPEDFDRAAPEFGDFDYNAIFKGDALVKVTDSLRYSSRSYYLLSKKQRYKQGLYFINIKISDEEGFTFIIRDLNEVFMGRFAGYKYKGENRRWIL